MTKLAERGIETKDVLCQADIKPWQLHKWLEQGLLPDWIGRIAYGGDGIHYWYPRETVGLARKIKAWREQGIGYRQIRELLKSEGAEVWSP
ncbi:hypothetical protein ES705_36394 [subsurface metagenome]